MNNTRKRAAKAKMLRECRAARLPNKAAKLCATFEHGEPPKETLADYYPLRRCPLGGLYAVTFRDEYGESWIRSWLVPGNVHDGDITHELGVFEHYSGPGRAFSRMPVVERSAHSTLVTQQCGYDI